jgi:hypothetical protein
MGGGTARTAVRVSKTAFVGIKTASFVKTGLCGKSKLPTKAEIDR